LPLSAEPADDDSDDDNNDNDNIIRFLLISSIHARTHTSIHPSTCIIHISIGIAGVPSAFPHIQRTGAWQALLYTI
jgi:hypothetical protein